MERLTIGRTWIWRFYAGPVAADELAAAGDGLGGLLFAHVWSWIKPLCHGLKWILSHAAAAGG